MRTEPSPALWADWPGQSLSVHADRALTELRRGRPVVMPAADGTRWAFAAVETLSPVALAQLMAASGRGVLLLSQQRVGVIRSLLKTVGWQADPEGSSEAVALRGRAVQATGDVLSTSPAGRFSDKGQGTLGGLGMSRAASHVVMQRKLEKLVPEADHAYVFPLPAAGKAIPAQWLGASRGEAVEFFGSLSEDARQAARLLPMLQGAAGLWPAEPVSADTVTGASGPSGASGRAGSPEERAALAALAAVPKVVAHDILSGLWPLDSTLLAPIPDLPGPALAAAAQVLVREGRLAPALVAFPLQEEERPGRDAERAGMPNDTAVPAGASAAAGTSTAGTSAAGASAADGADGTSVRAVWLQSLYQVDPMEILEFAAERPVHLDIRGQMPVVLERVSDAPVPLQRFVKRPGGGHSLGTAPVNSRFVVFRERDTDAEHVAVIVGNPQLDGAQPVRVRLHSSCLTGDLFGSLRCDCGDQLRGTVQRLAAEGGGIILYLSQEGRGIGIANKLRAYRLQDAGQDTVDANQTLGFHSDERNFAVAAAMLKALGSRRIQLLTNNPAKIGALRDAGIDVVEREPVKGAVNPHNQQYLVTKMQRAGHLFDRTELALVRREEGEGRAADETDGMPLSQAIRARIQQAGQRFHANDNIAPFIQGEQELDALQDEVASRMQALLESLVIDTGSDHNTQDTARRVAKMYLNEVFAGRYREAPDMTEFPNVEKLNELLVVGPITVRSACSHHFCPIMGRLWIGVLPNANSNLIGLSKYARLADWIMSRPQIQEEAVKTLADELEHRLRPDGLAVVMKADHFCMHWRGVKDESQMTSSVMRGAFLRNANLRREFLALMSDMRGH